MRMVLLTLFIPAVIGCSSPPPSPPVGESPHSGLSNLVHVTDKLISGSAPEGDEGFQSLVNLGVKTIISVDGATPGVQRAKRFGLRYVHLPIGYEGVPREQGLRIARAVHDLPGLVYIHCHHGKHRGPAAAAVARLCLDPSCRAQDAIAILHQAGTDPHYQGLYADVEHFRRPQPREFDAVSADFPETAKIGPLAQTMVEIDSRFEHLKQIRESHWQVPADHADLDPPYEALQLRELFAEATRTEEIKKRPDPFRKFLKQAEIAATELEQSLRDRTPPGPPFERLAAACNNCHAQFRDLRAAR